MTDAEIFASTLLLLGMSLDRGGISPSAYVTIVSLLQDESERLDVFDDVPMHLKDFAPVAAKLSLHLESVPIDSKHIQ